MVEVTVALLAAALLADTDPHAAVTALSAGSEPDNAVDRALAALAAAPADRQLAEAVAGALLEAARGQPEMTARLRSWLSAQDTMVNHARPTERGIHAHSDATADHSNTVGGSARIDGPSIQAHTIIGGVRLTTRGPDRPLPVPRQLPPVPNRFVDRERDLSALNSLTDTPLVVVSGPAGVGKTTFVSHWLRRIRDDFPDGQLYADIGTAATGAPVPPQEALGQFLRAYGFTDLPSDPAEQAALWRSVTGDLRIAVMLDNAVSAAQVRPLLPGGSGSLSVVASRRRLTGLLADGAAFHELGLLEPDAAVELLVGRIGDHRAEHERDAVTAVAELCAGLPLALCLAGARMAARPRQTVASLVEALNHEGGRLAALHADGHSVVQAALDESYASLPPDMAHGYRCLGALPFAVLGIEVVAAACDLPIPQAEAVADGLIEVNLLEDLGANRFRFHDLVRLHAAQRASQDQSVATLDGTRRAVGWYLTTATAAEALLTPSHRNLPREYPPGTPPPLSFHDPNAALDWLSREQSQLATALRIAADNDWHATVWQLADALWPLWNRLRPYDLWLEAHHKGLAAARRDGRPGALSRMLTSGGGALLNCGRPEEALAWYAEALDHARADQDQKAEAQALHGLGRAHHMLGRLSEATSFFSRALARREAIGYVRGAALTRVCLGEIAIAQGRFDQAVAELTTAHGELAAIPDPHDAARALVFLGRARAARGDFAAADSHLEAALNEFRSIGSVHWQGRTMEMLGLTALDRGARATARTWFEQSLAVYTSISPRDTRRLLDRINSLREPPAPA
ncbi:tetratricopeptide repeat protein [Streptomyces fuscichromogenes]|uniref:tetratricopeptide repeat protein n=1 Tax=Streptomyces fuscichromogenes TaxID=1324013 RepID=UPI0038036699